MKKIIFSIIATLVFILLPLTLKSQGDELFFKAAGAPSKPKVEATWNHYYTHAGVGDLCKRLAAAYPGFVTLESIGKSYQGRDIWVLTISDKKSGDPETKPGYWIDGNIHSIELQGTEMALYTAWYLCEMQDENAFISQLLKEKTFYISPTINPDGREYFTSKGVPPRSGLMPFDNDRDGLFDEDGADDLNGDKNISQIRRRSAAGTYIENPADPRGLIQVEPGKKGEFELLGSEGIDNDGDGQINEDGPGGYDGNRDWGFNWEPNYVQSGANRYPFSQPENKAVKDFVTKHRNISGSQSFHNSGGMILKGPSVQGGGAEVYSRADDEVMEAIGRKGELMIPGYDMLTIWKDMYTVWGGELDWWHGAMGVFVFSNELWNSFLMFYDTSKNDQYEFDRLLLFEDSFIPWQKVSHPVYGEIEVGGFSKMIGRLHPGFLIETDAHRNAAFCIYNAYQTPKLEIADIKVKKLDGGLNEVTATVKNTRMMPTHSASNIKFRIDPPDYITLEGGTVIAGMIVQNSDLNLTTEQKRNPGRIELENIPGYQSIKVRWIVKGGSKYSVKVESVKGGRASASTE